MTVDINKQFSSPQREKQPLKGIIQVDSRMQMLEDNLNNDASVPCDKKIR
jgi:hypothetical protein